MPRPTKDVVRGEILPSAWILQPDNSNGETVTRVIYMVQVRTTSCTSITPGFQETNFTVTCFTPLSMGDKEKTALLLYQMYSS